jgi:hypothetical protein
MKKWIFILGLVACQTARIVHAEGGCPPGQYPQQGQGWRTCVPIPGGGGSEQVAGPQWVDKWQAIATDTPLGILGVALDRSSSKEAERASVSDCEAKGGKVCIAQLSVRNGCIAMAVGENTKVIQSGASDSAAQNKAMNQCSDHNKKCVMYYKSCNFPSKI